MKKNFYITTTLPYVNADPHVGFAREIVMADVWARFHRVVDRQKVFFNTGTDEHGQKIYEKAKELGMDPQKYCDQKAPEFDKLKQALNLSYDNFIRTTDKNHMSAAQEFWKLCDKNGDIYKKNYKVKYCVGCELEKTDSELADGRCPLHPNKELEIIEEENYFFRFSKYQKRLLELYENNPDFVLPKKRFNEIKSFVERGLEDFSISRLRSKMPWGVPVPDDESQVMYVWFDALVNYISTLGWPSDLERFHKFWPGVQICGKDNLRQQSAMWQAMLMSADLPNSERIFVSGFINSGGQKMSKSLGNVISPYDMVEKFGADGTRYLLLSFGNFGEDTDLTWEQMIEKYNADLANGLGNLVSRVIKMAGDTEIDDYKVDLNIYDGEFAEKIKRMELGHVLELAWNTVRADNKYIDDKKPWELKKNNKEEFKEVMKKLFIDLYQISLELMPFLPETSEKIKKALETKESVMLFPRLK